MKSLRAFRTFASTAGLIARALGATAVSTSGTDSTYFHSANPI
ncbi:hypothetical protein [Pseudonocardia sp. DLS-67]